MKIKGVHFLALASILSAIALIVFGWQFYVGNNIELKATILPFVVFIGSTTQFLKSIKN